MLTGGVRTLRRAGRAGRRGGDPGLHVDTLFLGVHGMSPRAGFTTPNLLEAETDRALVASAHRLVVPADHSKWGTVGISTIAALSEAHVIISDSGLPDDAREELSAQAGELIVAEPERESRVAER
nr:hypothetical protein GCM10020093_047880 [Planobispora longispora]